MTAELTVRCDGRSRHGWPCDRRRTEPGALTLVEVRRAAAGAGWALSAGGADLCPSCRARTGDVVAVGPCGGNCPGLTCCAPATDPDRCLTCGAPEDSHPYRHPFRRLELGRTTRTGPSA